MAGWFLTLAFQLKLLSEGLNKTFHCINESLYPFGSEDKGQLLPPAQISGIYRWLRISVKVSSQDKQIKRWLPSTLSPYGCIRQPGRDLKTHKRVWEHSGSDSPLELNPQTAHFQPTTQYPKKSVQTLQSGKKLKSTWEIVPPMLETPLQICN